MIRNEYVVTGTVSLSAGVEKTLMLLEMGTTRRASIKSIHFGFKSTTSTDAPVVVQIKRGVTPPTANATGVTPVPVDSATPAAITAVSGSITGPSAGQVSTALSAEPTAGATAYRNAVSPVGGTVALPLADWEQPACATSSNLSVTLNAPQAQSNVEFTIVFDQ
jgi:hypothetical protein